MVDLEWVDILICIWWLMMEICSLGTLNPNSSQRRIIFDSEYISPALTAAAGEDGGQIPMILVIDTGRSN